jgi:hypothetical protein
MVFKISRLPSNVPSSVFGMIFLQSGLLHEKVTSCCIERMVSERKKSVSDVSGVNKTTDKATLETFTKAQLELGRQIITRSDCRTTFGCADPKQALKKKYRHERDLGHA